MPEKDSLVLVFSFACKMSIFEAILVSLLYHNQTFWHHWARQSPKLLKDRDTLLSFIVQYTVEIKLFGSLLGISRVRASKTSGLDKWFIAYIQVFRKQTNRYQTAVSYCFL